MKNKFRVSKMLKSALVAVLLVCLVTMSIPVSFAASTTSVVGLEVNDAVVIVGTNGYNSWDYDENGDGIEFFYYDVANFPTFTVTLSDGTVLEGDYGWAYDPNTDEEYYLECTDDQGYDNVWGVGTHTVTAEVMGVTATFNVNIVESPVAGVQTEALSIIENTNGSVSEVYDEYGEYVYSYYDYSYYDYVYTTVTLNDGTVLTDDSGFEYEGISYYPEFSDNQYTTPWTVGTHKVTGSIMGYNYDFDIEITETPIASLSVENIEVIENTYGYAYDEYDNEYACYSYYPEFSVTLKDGTVLYSEDVYLEYDGQLYWLEFTDDQSYDNQWGIGDHSVTASFMGVETTFTVTVTETPVASLSVENTEVIENTSIGYIYDEYDNEYVCYYYDPEFSVTLKDGSVLYSEDGWLEYGGEYYSLEFTDDQSYDNQWGIGDHSVTASLMGVESTFTVTITETPVQSIEIPDVNVIENANLYYDYDFDTNTEFSFYVYSVPQFTVTYTNGEVVTYTDYQVEYNGEYYYLSTYDDQSSYNKWELGAHTADFELLGFNTTFNVNIIESPVVNVSFEDISLIENANCYTETEEDGSEWNRYYYFSPQCNITFKDNTTVLCDEFEYLGQTYSPDFVSDDQSVDNQWKLGGVYSADFNMMGVQGKSKVNIIESPVVSVSIDDVTVTADEINSPDFNPYDYINIAITFNDGTVITELSEYLWGMGYYVEYEGQTYPLRFWSEDDLSDGTALVNAEIMGKETTFNFTVKGEETVKLYGDANSDGVITVSDATQIQKHIARLDSISAEALPLCDLNNDNDVTVTDATAIQKHLAHLETSPLIGQPTA